MGLFDVFKKKVSSDGPISEYTDNSYVETHKTFEYTGSFCLVVEDIFNLSGRGTVVVGRVQNGSISVGEQVVIVRGQECIGKTEVTGLEKFRAKIDTAVPGDAIGMLLNGIKSTQLQKGDRILK